MSNKVISASILAADFANLGRECENALKAGADNIHFDVMDHHFVPNLSFGPVVCQSLRKAGISAPIDVHLMVEKPEQYVEAFADAGANMLVFHPEATQDVSKTIQKIQGHNMQAGLAFNPDKPVDIDKDTLHNLGMILLMSVHPGFAGQSFIEGSLEKIKSTRELIDQHNASTKLGIDGGVKNHTIGETSRAGADFFVVGSGIFGAKNYDQRLRELRAEIK